MENIERLVTRLTPSEPFRDTLEIGGDLAYLKLALRADNTLYEVFYDVLKERAASTSSQTRFLCLQLTHYIFWRSAHFRQLLCHSRCLPFLLLFRDNLPKPEAFRQRLRAIVPFIVQRWNARFGSIYSQLVMLTRVFKERKTEAQLKDEARNRDLNSLSDDVIERWTPMLEEMDNLCELLVPSPDRFEVIVPSDEYREIVLRGIRDNNRLLQKCVQDADMLRVRGERFNSTPELSRKIGEFVERVSRVEARVAAVASGGEEEDEFEDVEESNNEEFEFEDVGE